jgi:hypothetical protein
MTMGAESFSNGSAKAEDRFTGSIGTYRQGGRRDSGAVLPIDSHGDDLPPRNGSAPSLERIGGSLDSGSPIASSMTAPKLMDPAMPELGPRLADSVFAGDGWLDTVSGSVVDHPLLRGLLLELPPKGSSLEPEWLDRWFEAARSILELLYKRETGRG